MNDRSSGALFKNDKRTNDSQPHYRGEATLSKDLLKELVEVVKSGGEAKIALAVWPKTSKNGRDYLSMSLKKHEPYRKAESEEDPF